jgi:hypothetical protein
MPAQRLSKLTTLLTLLGWTCVAAGYPLYGSEERGILRLQQARLAHEGIIPGRQKVAGELLPLAWQAADLRVQGLIGSPAIGRSRRDRQPGGRRS